MPVGLTSVVPTVARRKLAGLPKALSEDQVRLGLSIGEVATLRLEDIARPWPGSGAAA